jgi:hypothetical protein
MKLPGNARLGSTLYFKSPSLGEITFIDVDVTPDDNGEVALLPEGIVELTRRWCAALNRMRNVKDFRPATRREVTAYVQRPDGVDQERVAAQNAQRSTRAASAPSVASGNGVRYILRKLESLYFGMQQRALAALRSRPRSWVPERRHIAIRQPNWASGHVESPGIRAHENER